MGHELWCYGLPLDTAVTLSPEQTRVIVASNLPVEQALFAYRKRWRIECLFRHLKTGGFQLEETHMVDHDKLERLWCLVTLYLWCTLLGQPEPVRIKAHGRPAKAVFVAGLNLLTRGLAPKRWSLLTIHRFSQRNLRQQCGNEKADEHD
jgi:hypothetical protein